MGTSRVERFFEPRGDDIPGCGTYSPAISALDLNKNGGSASAFCSSTDRFTSHASLRNSPSKKDLVESSFLGPGCHNVKVMDSFDAMSTAKHRSKLNHVKGGVVSPLRRQMSEVSPEHHVGPGQYKRTSDFDKAALRRGISTADSYAFTNSGRAKEMHNNGTNYITMAAGPGGENLGPGSYSVRDLKANFSLTLEKPSETAFGMSWSSANFEDSLNASPINGSARQNVVDPEALMGMTGRKPRRLRTAQQELTSQASTTSIRRGTFFGLYLPEEAAQSRRSLHSAGADIAGTVSPIMSPSENRRLEAERKRDISDVRGLPMDRLHG